ncbi:MAG: creatininase family protein [Candidatus Bathyarchaeia archaeon]|jgi:creatinine amidohydrolase
MSPEIVMENMTWEEIRDAIRSGSTNVAFAVASWEQHGPQLPISTDTLLGDEIARRVASKLAKTLVGPTIRPGYSPHHMTFPGTITLRGETLEMLIEDYCISLAKHGFKNIVVICSHGGNTPTMKLACRKAAGSVVGVNVIPIYDIVPYAPEGTFDRESGFHANRAETSLILYIREGLVKKDKIQKDPMRLNKNIIDYSILLAQGFVSDISSTGVLGDPTGASSQEGEKILEVIVENMTKEIRLLLGADDSLGISAG